MDSQAPPLHYPNAHDSTAEVYRTRRDELYSPTLVNGGYPLPEYGDEPPQYQETPEELAKSKKRVRNVLIVRVMTSMFIALIVSLIVAGAVTKIQQGRTKERSEETNDIPDKVTEETDPVVDTDIFATKAHFTTTSHHLAGATATDNFLTFDCQCWSEDPAAPTPTTLPAVCETETAVISEPLEHWYLMGVSRYSSSACRLARASFGGTGDVVRYMCTLSCRDPNIGGKSLEGLMEGSWELDLDQ